MCLEIDHPRQASRWLAAPLLVAACAGMAASKASTPSPTALPRTTGPLTLQRAHSYGCFGTGAACFADFVLDPAATNDPQDDWHALWAADPSPPRLPPAGFCLTEVADALFWGPIRTAPAPARTYPPAGTTGVDRDGTARLLVDARGHAPNPGRLNGATGWPPGTLTVLPGRGTLTVYWDGRTRSRFVLTLAAEVANPGGNMYDGVFATTSGSYGLAVKAPCSALPARGRGFLARIVRRTLARGQTAWLQVRIPGTQTPCVRKSGIAGCGGPPASAAATVTAPGTLMSYGYEGPAGGAGLTESGDSPFRFTPILGTAAIALQPTSRSPGSYAVRVTLSGPTGTRHYRLSFRVR
jgi:hypothetical protein